MTTALVTGAAKRIGKAIALSLAEAGYDIVIHYNTSVAEATQLQDQIKQMGQQAWLAQADFTKQDQSKFIEQVFSVSVPPEVVIHSASMYEPCSFINDNIAELDRNWAIHCRTPYLINQALVRSAKHGHIICISDAAFHKSKFFPYMFSKHGVNTMAQMLAKELAPHFRVNAIAPGAILPPLTDVDYDAKQLNTSIPLGHHGGVVNICDTVLFLLSNDYITGQVIYIDGGGSL